MSRKLTVAFFSFLFLAAVPDAGFANGLPEEYTSIRTGRWVDQDGEVRVLLTELGGGTPTCVVSRVFVEYNGDRHCVLTSDYRPRIDRAVESLLCLSPRWEVERIRHSSLSFPDLKSMDSDSFYRTLAKGIEAKQGDPWVREVRSSSGFHAVIELPQHETEREYLWRSGLDLEIYRDLPEDLRGTVVDLKRVLCDTDGLGGYCTIDDLLGLLTQVIRDYSAPPVKADDSIDEWKQVTEAARLGYTLSPDEGVFLESFDSYSMDNPFAGTCLDGRIPGGGR